MDTSKIIKGVVNSGRYTVTAPIVKEDYGLYLQIEGVELPQTYEVDFSNSEHNGTSVTMIGNADGVLIPHQFIDTGKDIFAFLYHVGADFGRTVYKFRIPNKVRPDRTNEEPTPEEQSVIDQTINALNEAVAQTAQDVIDADASAQNASADADRAEQAKEDASTFAQRSANSAQASADYSSSAQTSATASAQSASQSAQIKADVEDLVDDAQGYASASAQSASASANSASQAQGYANTASTKATEASTSASTASQKATEASQSAENASQSAQTAEQAKTASQTAQGLAESARDLAQGYAGDAQGYANDAQASAEGISASASQIAQNTANILKAFPTDTTSGSIASFSDGADDLPLKSLVVDINPVQDLSHGDPSPENICPISGWTSVGVEQSGVNVWDEEWEVGIYDNKTGEKRNSTTAIRSKNKIRCLSNVSYYVLVINSSTVEGFAVILYYDDYDNFIGLNSIRSNGVVITTPSACGKMAFYVASSYGTTYNHDISINYPSTDHDYHPYTGRSITINLGQTVYGGKLDVLTGELTVYPYYASYNGETLTGKWISDRDKYVSGTTPTIGAQVVNIGAQGVTVQLEPHEVESLYGVNNIWADSGDTEVEYRADTKAYIAKKIAEALASLT